MKEKKKVYDYENDLKEISSLEKKGIKTSIETLSGYRNLIRINIDKSLIKSDLIDKNEEIIFILLIKYNHPNEAPILYCLTKFCNPELCDVRDFLEEVISHPWKTKRINSLKKIINLIPFFINNYLQNEIKKNDLKIIGKYYLDNSYDLNILKLFPNLFFGEAYELVAYGNDKKIYEEKRILMITEGIILLFVEKGIFESQKLKLIFWGPISCLSLMKEIKSKNAIELKWKAKKDKTSLMRLKIENEEQIFEILMNCLSKKKIDFKVESQNSGAKKGEIPKIDIVEIEQEISKLEIKIKIIGIDDDSNIDYTKKLMNLYEKAVQYYSALNDYRYQIYLRKTKKLISQISENNLGYKKGNKKVGEKRKKKKGKKGKLKKEKLNKEKENIKKEDEKKIKEENKEDKKEDKKKEENKTINTQNNQKVEEKLVEKNEKKLEKKEEKIEEKKEGTKKEKKEENSEKENKKNDHQNTANSGIKKEEEINKGKKGNDNEEKSDILDKIEKSGFNFDLDDD